MKQLLLALGLLLSAYTSYAQQPTAPVAATPVPAAAPDTVQAIRTMFRQHRVGGVIWASVGGIFTGRIIGTAIAEGDATGTVPGVLLFGGVPVGIAIGKFAHFSAAKETAVVAAYTQ